MLKIDDLKEKFSNMDFREKRVGLFKVIIPFFHEDGDMYDLFVEESPVNNSKVRISDYGLTLMKLSYDFSMDTENKKQILKNIVVKNRGNIDDGNIFLDVESSQLESAIYQMIQIISKVSNMDIISHEAMKSYFYEFLDEFITEKLQKFTIEKNAMPLGDADLKVDYQIGKNKPIYLFGVKDNSKASKVIITCLTAQNKRIPHRSLVINDDFDSLSGFNRKQLINTVDKQFTSLDDFKILGEDYLNREIA